MKKIYLLVLLVTSTLYAPPPVIYFATWHLINKKSESTAEQLKKEKIELKKVEHCLEILFYRENGKWNHCIDDEYSHKNCEYLISEWTKTLKKNEYNANDENV